MKLPEPYLCYADGETYTPQAVTELFADDSGLEKLYSENQVKELLEQAGRDNADSLVIAHMHGADQMKQRYAPVLQQALEELERAETIMLRECGIGVVNRLTIEAIRKVLK